jgi:hypothetical protein
MPQRHQIKEKKKEFGWKLERFAHHGNADVAGSGVHVVYHEMKIGEEIRNQKISDAMLISSLDPKEEN